MASCNVLTLLTTPIRSSFKDFTSAFLEVMDVAVKVINSIRFVQEQKITASFNFWPKKMGAQHVGLLLYTKVLWLSKGRCIHRLYELRKEVEVFLQKNEGNLHVQFRNEEFIIMFAFLANVFGHFNELN